MALKRADIGKINRTMVLENSVIFGTVNANRRHYQMAAEVLAKADPNWLSRMISRREHIGNWQKAFERHPDDIKVVIHFNHQ
jgi:glucose 1-dehydrogenase